MSKILLREAGSRFASFEGDGVDYLGTFETSGTVDLSDPCYDRDVWCRINDVEVRPGTYHAAVVMSDEGTWGRRVAELVAIHDDLPTVSLYDFYPLDGGTVGVDSGQAGIFDVDHYKNEDTLPEGYEPSFDRKDAWYSICCEITLGERIAGASGGVVPGGCVSRTGYGDGSYEAQAVRDENGQIVALRILFLDFEDEDEDWDEYDDDYEDYEDDDLYPHTPDDDDDWDDEDDYQSDWDL